MSMIYKGINIGLATSSIGVLAIVLLGITHVFELSDPSRKFIYKVFTYEILANFSDLLVTVLEGIAGKEIRIVMLLSANLTYVFCLLAEFSLLQYVMSAIEDEKFYKTFKRRMTLEFIFFHLLILVNAIWGCFFTISEQNMYVYAKGVLWLVPFLLCSIPLFELYYVLYYVDHKLSDEKVQAFSIFVMIPIVSGILTAWESEITFFPFFTTFCCIILTFFLFSEELYSLMLQEQQK